MRTAMTLDQAKAQVENLLREHWNVPEEAELKIELWFDGKLSEAPPCVGVRVAEISTLSGNCGSSLMAGEPDALATVAAVERCIIERMVCTTNDDEWDHEVEDADWRLEQVINKEEEK